ncbi:unnamed protein product [Lepeophtheirus salmonis]|uniref:(salmon louse) hypothetical protein n=1 Tax=Lepeophtheirus salmonis TaxID=72036 RepID=A0A7R8CHZ6_LEPSM|nr:unnamed protein product [Lepeophtheirus salmonis]CAF2827315.1 unnamed protein product [Lepeophtheirus salmonis]
MLRPLSDDTAGDGSRRMSSQSKSIHGWQYYTPKEEKKYISRTHKRSKYPQRHPVTQCPSSQMDRRKSRVYFSAQPTKLSPMSCHYNSNRSVSLHPYFYLNSKDHLTTLRYTPASTEKSTSPPCHTPTPHGYLYQITLPPFRIILLEGEVVTRIPNP